MIKGTYCTQCYGQMDMKSVVEREGTEKIVGWKGRKEGG